MSFSEFQAILDRVTYKPGYTLHANAEMGSSHIRLCVVATVKDVFNPTKEIPLTAPSCFPLEGIRNEDDAIHVIKMVVTNLEMHERDEWLKLDAVCVTNPHPNPFK